MNIEKLKSLAIKFMEAPPDYKKRNQGINITFHLTHGS